MCLSDHILSTFDEVLRVPVSLKHAVEANYFRHSSFSCAAMCLHPVQHICDTAPLVCGWLITTEVENMVSIGCFAVDCSFQDTCTVARNECVKE